MLEYAGLPEHPQCLLKGLEVVQIDGGSADLAERREGMARFRNLLVHQYDDVDDRRVHGIMRQDLEDLGRFAAAVLQAFPDLA